jgi:hypothetical protein
MALRERLAAWLGHGRTSAPDEDVADHEGHSHEYVDAKHDHAVASGVGGSSPVLGRGGVKNPSSDFEGDQEAPRRRTS